MDKINIDIANLKMLDKWLRLVFMILFLLINYILRLAVLGIAGLQFLIILVTNKGNENLLQLGKSLSTLSYQILLFLTFNSEEKPFPFGEWPKD